METTVVTIPPEGARIPFQQYDVVIEDQFWVVRPRNGHAKPSPPKSRRAKMLEQVAVYEQLHPELKETHLGQYVAIHKGELVDADSDKIVLLHRLDEKLPDKNRVVLVRQVRPELPQPIRASSALYKLSPQ